MLLGELDGDPHVSEVDKVDAELRFERLDEELLVDDAFLDENGTEAFVPRLLQRERPFELFLRDCAVVDENVAQT